MYVEFTPTVVEARIYRQGGYAEKSAYVGSFLVHIVGDEAWITLLTGEEKEDGDETCAWSKELDSQTYRYLVSCGVKYANYECKGEKIRRTLTMAGKGNSHGSGS